MSPLAPHKRQSERRDIERKAEAGRQAGSGRQIKTQSGSANKMPLKTKRQRRAQRQVDYLRSKRGRSTRRRGRGELGRHTVENFFGKFQASHSNTHTHTHTGKRAYKTCAHTPTHTYTQRRKRRQPPTLAADCDCDCDVSSVCYRAQQQQQPQRRSTLLAFEKNMENL